MLPRLQGELFIPSKSVGLVWFCTCHTLHIWFSDGWKDRRYVLMNRSPYIANW